MDGVHLSITESPETRIRRLVSENPVVIFTRSTTCWICHVMNRLLWTIGVHPTVIQLEDDEIVAVHDGAGEIAPALFIGGTRVGGLESLLALHLRGQLVPKLIETGALRGERNVHLHYPWPGEGRLQFGDYSGNTTRLSVVKYTESLVSLAGFEKVE